VIGGRLSFASHLFSDDHTLARSTVARLAELDVETIAFSHYPPWRQEARAALEGLAAAAGVTSR
jgi:hypothetical protein